MQVHISYGDVNETIDVPDDDFVVVCAPWSEVRDAITSRLESENGIMRNWKAAQLADQAVEAIAELPLGTTPGKVDSQ